MAEVNAELRQLNWKQIGVGALFQAALLVTAVLVMGFGMTYAGRWLGWPESMIRIGANVGIGIVTLPFLMQAVKPLIRMYRSGDGDEDGSEWFTTDEITIQATSVRRRHYLKQIGKTVGGIVMAAMGVFNVHGLITMRSKLYPEFQQIFGDSAGLNYRFMIGMMAFMTLVGVAIAVRGWLNRYQDQDESIIDAMRELED